VRAWATFEDRDSGREFGWELALTLFYAALAAFLAAVGAKLLFVLALAVTVVFGYWAVRRVVSHRRVEE
jgi:flagellar biogenesis protein FliO